MFEALLIAPSYLSLLRNASLEILLFLLLLLFLPKINKESSSFASLRTNEVAEHILFKTLVTY
jgi:hypothetical protein